MDNQKLQSLGQTRTGIPEELQERFVIKRIDEKDIEITIGERDVILKALNDGQRFIQVGKFTIMLNAIKSIDPKYGEKNIPPRPTEELELVNGIAHETPESKKLTDLWDTMYGKKLIK